MTSKLQRLEIDNYNKYLNAIKLFLKKKKKVRAEIVI